MKASLNSNMKRPRFHISLSAKHSPTSLRKTDQYSATLPLHATLAALSELPASAKENIMQINNKQPLKLKPHLSEQATPKGNPSIVSSNNSSMTGSFLTKREEDPTLSQILGLRDLLERDKQHHDRIFSDLDQNSSVHDSLVVFGTARDSKKPNQTPNTTSNLEDLTMELSSSNTSHLAPIQEKKREAEIDLLSSLNAEDISSMARLSSNGGEMKIGSAFSSKISITSKNFDHTKQPSLVNYDSNLRQSPISCGSFAAGSPELIYDTGDQDCKQRQDFFSFDNKSDRNSRSAEWHQESVGSNDSNVNSSGSSTPLGNIHSTNTKASGRCDNDAYPSQFFNHRCKQSIYSTIEEQPNEEDSEYPQSRSSGFDLLQQDNMLKNCEIESLLGKIERLTFFDDSPNRSRCDSLTFQEEKPRPTKESISLVTFKGMENTDSHTRNNSVYSLAQESTKLRSSLVTLKNPGKEQRNSMVQGGVKGDVSIDLAQRVSTLPNLDTVVSFKNSEINPQQLLRQHSISSSTTRKNSDASEFKYALSSSSKKRLEYDQEDGHDELIAEAIDGVEISCQSDSIRSDPRSQFPHSQEKLQLESGSYSQNLTRIESNTTLGNQSCQQKTEYEESPPLSNVRKFKERRPPKNPRSSFKNESLMTLRMQDDQDLIQDDLEPVVVGDEFNRDSVVTMRQRREEDVRGSLMPEEKFGVIPVIDVKSKGAANVVNEAHTSSNASGRMAIVFSTETKKQFIGRDSNISVTRESDKQTRRVSCSASKHGDSFEVFKRTDATIMPRNPLTTAQNSSFENGGRSSSVQHIRTEGSETKSSKNLTIRRKGSGLREDEKRRVENLMNLDISISSGESSVRVGRDSGREKDRLIESLMRKLKMKEKVIESLQKENRALHQELAETQCQLQDFVGRK